MGGRTRQYSKEQELGGVAVVQAYMVTFPGLCLRVVLVFEGQTGVQVA